MKKIISIILIVVIIFLVTPYAHEYFSMVSKPGNPITINIPKGATADSIAQILKNNEIIDYKITFKLKVKLLNLTNKLNYGSFTLDDGMCLNDVIKILTSPIGQDSISLVVPEGFSAEQIGARAEELGICSQEDFLSCLNKEIETKFYKFIPKGDYKYKLQGFLFPETYMFYKDTPPETVVKTMVNEFVNKYEKNIGNIDENVFNIVTKASLIEKEAMLERERPIIAGVIENRLKASMPLQIDAAIVYAISNGLYNVSTVYFKDLDINSPYNIYRNKGLPVGPICNPGITSLKAAKNPKSSNYLYYHTDTNKKDGSHIFSESYDEHLDTME